LIKGSLTDAEDTSSIHGLIDEYNVEFKSDREEAIALANIPAILNRCMQNTSMIDFDDMIWLPLVLNMPLPTFDTLFVDEAQDFNEMQRELISRCVGNGRCIIVGDPNQAIYGFRGADSNSMNMFSQRLENGSREIKRFSLSLTWRCPKSVVAEANRYVTNFNCRSDAEDGNVMVNAAFTPLEGDMVLCRYNAPLVSAFYDLIQ
jgi:DNA helicase-2/ATP-dependent DNA helicase PcrA